MQPTRTVHVNPGKLSNLTCSELSDDAITRHDYLDDVTKLVRLLNHHECLVNPMVAYWMWFDLSKSMGTSWLCFSDLASQRALDMLIGIGWLTSGPVPYGDRGILENIGTVPGALL